MAILLVLIVCVFAVAGLIVVLETRSERAAIDAHHKPSRELNHAIRLLNRVENYDDLMPSLPDDLRRDVKKFTGRYYKELD